MEIYREVIMHRGYAIELTETQGTPGYKVTIHNGGQVIKELGTLKIKNQKAIDTGKKVVEKLLLDLEKEKA